MKGFAQVAAPLYDIISGEDNAKKTERVKLSAEALDRLQPPERGVSEVPYPSLPRL